MKISKKIKVFLVYTAQKYDTKIVMNDKRLSIAGTTMKLLNGFGVYSYSVPVITRQIICP